MNTNTAVETELDDDNLLDAEVTEESGEVETDSDETESTADARETVIIKPSVIPTKEEMAELCSSIKDNFDFDVEVKPVLFRFKTTKDTDTGIETKREPMELPIPYPTVQGIIKILETGGKELELLMDAVESVVTQTARSMISDDQELNAVTLPTDKLSWKAISEMPKPERMGGGIAKDVWEDFGKDYIKTMPEVTGKSVERVTHAAKLLVGKFAAVKTNIPVLNLLTQQLAIYMEHSKRADEFTGCVEFLVDKADKLVNTSPEELLANL